MYFRVFIKFRVCKCIHDTRYTISTSFVYTRSHLWYVKCSTVCIACPVEALDILVVGGEAVSDSVNDLKERHWQRPGGIALVRFDAKLPTPVLY